MADEYVEVYEDEGGKWRWRKIAANGATVASSGESFDERSNAVEAAEREVADTELEVRVDG